MSNVVCWFSLSLSPYNEIVDSRLYAYMEILLRFGLLCYLHCPYYHSSFGNTQLDTFDIRTFSFRLQGPLSAIESIRHCHGQLTSLLVVAKLMKLQSDYWLLSRLKLQ